ncbi:amidotransferase [Methanosarcina sp. 2.H.T.1A.6]|uniref:type 1 glutamine amidotransferase n=1 Tax=unclassified Methanosarcina TaxID=2644672 RepID=UPI000621C380|nr:MULTISPECIES: type 1 glutamine amidotransferase [unclassified Methanosarcina]KKG18565.1 amidotransferase [Methanosarcina sp. 2.H.T.1A.3]KKG20965.1 amidotransferase [Methanosarcina sp. 2.H.T.1A.6]KKG22960.1 amidotransferase [Methanosarcina sp. 2.H.T.1A.8]KKG28233.1 amidotransferase [Methanosarcina sp. 2.H.T.1A.15]
MKIHCLQHLKNETLGNIGTWAALKGHRLTKTMLYEKPVFPEPEEFDMLLIMGGTMSVYQEKEFPWLRPEKEFVKKVIDTGKPVLGSCFGAQMIAEVLGGKVTRNRFKEIGWHRVKALAEENLNNERGINSELPAGLFPEFTAFMWHGDTFEIPPGAVRLFESEACPNQGYIYKGNVIGLQFHPEADRRWIRNIIDDSGHELVEGKFIQSEEEIYGRESLFEDSNDLAFSLMDWFEKKCEN